MTNTPNTLIPYVPEGALDPAAGLNLALIVIDALLQTQVLGIENEPPSAADGDTYIVGTGMGLWAGEDNNLARYVSEGDFWQFYEAGTQVRIVLDLSDISLRVYVEGEGWQSYPALSHLTDAADDTAAAGAGIPIGRLYRNGSVVMIRVS